MPRASRSPQQGMGRAHCPCLPENSLTSCLALVGEDRSGGRPVHSDQALGSKTPTTLFLGFCSWKLDDTALLLRSGPPGFPGLCHLSQRTSDFALKERQPCGHTGCPRTREMLHARWTCREGGDSSRGPGPSPAGAALCTSPRGPALPTLRVAQLTLRTRERWPGFCKPAWGPSVEHPALGCPPLTCRRLQAPRCPRMAASSAERSPSVSVEDGFLGPPSDVCSAI